MVIGLAIADELRGPYHKYESNPVITFERDIEDPYVWHDGELYRVIVSELGFEEPAGWILSSRDGRNWSDPEAAYPTPRTFRGFDQRLEEPNLLFRDGRPTHLFNVMGACAQDKAYSGHVFAIEES